MIASEGVRAHATTTGRTANRKRSPKEGSRAATSLNRARGSAPLAFDGGGAASAALGPVTPSLEAVAEWLKTQVREILDKVRDRGQVLTTKIQEWMDTLAEAIADGGPGVNAALAGVRAVLKGQNPVMGAVKGLVSGLSGTAKVALVLLVVVGLLLGPVLLVALLLALLIAAVVAAVRAATE